MDTLKITKALDLAEDATEAQVLERIADLRREAGDDEEASIVEQIDAGTHPQVVKNDDGSLHVELLYPMTIGKEQIVQLTFRAPKMKHLRAMDQAKGDVAKAQALIAACTNLASKQLDELDRDDLTVCNAALRFFSEKRRRTGSASSASSR